MNIITIQHTQSLHHTNQMVGSWTDWPLTELGIAQSRRIVQRIAQTQALDGYHIYSSDLQRCRYLAELLQQKTGGSLTVTEQLRGKYYGSACGKSDEWLEAHRLPCHGYDVRDIDYRYLEDAENTMDAYARVRPLFERLLDAGKDFILVGHGDILNVFYAFWLGIPVESLRNVDIFTQPGSVSVFKMLPNRKRVALRIGDMSFMEGAEELL